MAGGRLQKSGEELDGVTTVGDRRIGDVHTISGTSLRRPAARWETEKEIKRRAHADVCLTAACAVTGHASAEQSASQRCMRSGRRDPGLVRACVE